MLTQIIILKLIKVYKVRNFFFVQKYGKIIVRVNLSLIHICHEASQEDLDSLGEIKGFILNGGPHKSINGFRVDASEAIYENEIPTYSVDHASWKGVDLFTWPKDEVERKERIGKFLSETCKLDIL